MLLIVGGERVRGLEHVKVLSDDGRELLGWFDIEFFPKSKKASIHSHLRPRYRGQGYGREMYDKAEQLLVGRGFRFVPSPKLSQDALRVWESRAPKKLRNHIRRDNGGATLKNSSVYYGK